MLKSLRRLIVRGIAGAGKTRQRQAGKLLKALLAPPASKARPKPKTAPARTPVKPAGAQRTAVRQPSHSRIASAPGKWLASYYPTAADSGALTAHRLGYYLYLPTHGPASAPAASASTSAAVDSLPRAMPLLVMLHGCEQTATQFAQGTRMNALAEKLGYAVLYPQQSLQTHAQRCWKWYDAATQAGGGDVGIIVGIIKKVAATRGIDSTRIYICGMSAGAAMAHIVALHHPELIAAVGLHSGPMFGAGHNHIGAYRVMQHGDIRRVDQAMAEVLRKAPLYPVMPAILIHGQGDHIVRAINQTQLERQWLMVNSRAIDSVARPVIKAGGAPGRKNRANAYSIRDFYQKNKPLLRIVHIANLGHAWSGGDDALPFNSAAGPDAGKLMLAFFARHQRVAAPGAGRPLRNARS